MLPGNSGTGSQRHVVKSASNARLDGFEVRNGYESADSSNQLKGGGGIYNDQAVDYFYVSRCKIDNNSGTIGGGMLIQPSSKVQIYDTVFNNNSTLSSKYGGGLYIGRNSRVLLSKDKFTSNTAFSNARGGAVAWMFDSSGSWGNVDDCEFVSNQASAGGAFYIHNVGSVTPNDMHMIGIGYSRFDHNAATNGMGGAIFADKVQIGVGSSIFYANSAKTGGGAIYKKDKGTLSLLQLSFAQNTVDSGDGGALDVDCSNADSVVIMNSILAFDQGGGKPEIKGGTCVGVGGSIIRQDNDNDFQVMAGYGNSVISKNADPHYMDYTGGDLRLDCADSPAKDTGWTGIIGYDFDIDGNGIVNVPDAGAYECQP